MKTWQMTNSLTRLSKLANLPGSESAADTFCSNHALVWLVLSGYPDGVEQQRIEHEYQTYAEDLRGD